MRKFVIVLAFVVGVAVGGLFAGERFGLQTPAYGSTPMDIFTVYNYPTSVRLRIRTKYRSQYVLGAITKKDAYTFYVELVDK